jgi:hypothetical protein
MSSDQPTEVVVVDIRMRFASMVIFMVKWVVASIPALIILFILGMIGSALFAGFFGWQGRMMHGTGYF